ncbi:MULTISPECIES: co-chaperone GroES [Porphyromonadaceae]|uniref:Co-chaperonin GroES n=1 Tax=Sanguibacteroides justesenii TaxID=1547597 RepID=A0A0C3MD79_9PORP|nr:MULTISPECIES: co-chaperone GroES [Porphyromonadaceae]KIO44338.1 molecular chaperone GroES [Sanguibacteroides justesenii]KIO45405.1 molecular chaperone GroES [Sanguibacteroides justesenii]MCR9011355.1 co-chaperone GroES [Gabonibacter chumensis]PXZ44690.1 co-chaperone GroES [Sanguibacteroides justesenii]
MALKTVLSKIIVEPVEAETKTASGIIIPDSAQEKPQKGVVIATGNGKHDEPMEIKVGDTVLFGKYAGTELHIDDKKYLVMNQTDVLVVL